MSALQGEFNNHSMLSLNPYLCVCPCMYVRVYVCICVSVCVYVCVSLECKDSLTYTKIRECVCVTTLQMD